MYLYTRDECLIDAVAPVVQLTSPSTEAVVEQQVVLACAATGFPIPTVQWLHNGNDLLTSLDGRITFQEIDFADFYNNSNLRGSGLGSAASTGDAETELITDTGFELEQLMDLGVYGVVGLVTFSRVSREDNGLYECLVENSIPIQVTSDPIALKVTG